MIASVSSKNRHNRYWSRWLDREGNRPACDARASLCSMTSFAPGPSFFQSEKSHFFHGCEKSCEGRPMCDKQKFPCFES